MKKLLSTLILPLALAFLFTGCSFSSLYSWIPFGSSEPKLANELHFKLNDDEKLKVLLNPYEYQSQYSLCVSNGFTLKGENETYGKLFVEEITLDQNCQWNGLSTSFFTALFKESLKLDSMRKVQAIEVKNYSFATYRVNDEFYVNLILQYSTFKDRIIVDYSGRLTKALLQNLKPEFELKYVDRLRLEANYDDSLVLKSMFKGYFSREREFIRD